MVATTSKAASMAISSSREAERQAPRREQQKGPQSVEGKTVKRHSGPLRTGPLEPHPALQAALPRQGTLGLEKALLSPP